MHTVFNRAVFGVACLAAATSFPVGSVAQTPAVAGDADSVVYKEVDGRSLRIDITKPTGWQPSDQRPAIVFFHGGGWVGGKPGQFAEHSQEFASLGIVCFRVEYRLLNRKNNDPPEICVADATDAVQYVRSHAKELGVDPERIAAAGGSAGGHLAAYLGMMDDVTEPTSRKPQALLLFNPVYDNGPNGWGTARVGKRYQEFSPLHNITADDPPAIVFLGTADNLIPVATAEKFQAAMREAGLQSELRLYEGQPHGFFNAGRDNGKWYRQTMDESIAFLRSLDWIKPPAAQ